LFIYFSSAEPKIADYAFTTVVPNIGIVQLTEYDGAVPSLQSSNNSSSSGSSSGGGIVGSGSRSCRLGTGSSTSFRLSSGRYEATHRFSLLDVPGLLPGAHFGVGLGNAFLRHIQKCR
jgi:GTP-binding protein